MSLCLVTCGPASTRIDDVRRITNFSTGEIGTLLTETLNQAGLEVLCLRGEGATFREPAGVEVISFFSNDDLLNRMEEISRTRKVSQVFHATALTDFEVASVTNDAGQAVTEAKIPSSSASLHIHLRPARKVISELRRLFPAAYLTGWKYELSGTQTEAFSKAEKQIALNRTDACVLNGAAHGPGFTWLTPETQETFPDKSALVAFLARRSLAIAKKLR